jgi:hypothetical protein
MARDQPVKALDLSREWLRRRQKSAACHLSVTVLWTSLGAFHGESGGIARTLIGLWVKNQKQIVHSRNHVAERNGILQYVLVQ